MGTTVSIKAVVPSAGRPANRAGSTWNLCLLLWEMVMLESRKAGVGGTHKQHSLVFMHSVIHFCSESLCCTEAAPEQTMVREHRVKFFPGEGKWVVENSAGRLCGPRKYLVICTKNNFSDS